MSTPIASSKSALLVMDYQHFIVDNYLGKEAAPSFLATTANLIDKARAAGVMVMYVTVGFRAGHPEISTRNMRFSTLKEKGLFRLDDAATAIHPSVAPRENEPVVVKHRVSAFTGTDLGMLLRANDIDTLILSGITTSGVVLSTTRQAADLDYRIIIAGDCCTDPDRRTHDVLLANILPQQAQVSTSHEIAARFERMS